MFSPLALAQGTCSVCEDSCDGHWQGGFANSQLCAARWGIACVCGTFMCLSWKTFYLCHVEVICTFLCSVHVWQFCLFVTVSGSSKRSGWGRCSVVIQESCSFEGWVCTCVFTFFRVKINSNSKTLFGTETFQLFSGDWLLGRDLMTFSNHSAHNSNLSSLVVC